MLNFTTENHDIYSTIYGVIMELSGKSIDHVNGHVLDMTLYALRNGQYLCEKNLKKSDGSNKSSDFCVCRSHKEVQSFFGDSSLAQELYQAALKSSGQQKEKNNKTNKRQDFNRELPPTKPQMSEYGKKTHRVYPIQYRAITG